MYIIFVFYVYNPLFNFNIFWKPTNVCGKEFVNYQREAMSEIDKYCCYDKTVFKKKFGVGLINKKTCRHIHLPDKLVMDNVDAKCLLYFG